VYCPSYNGNFYSVTVGAGGLSISGTFSAGTLQGAVYASGTYAGYGVYCPSYGGYFASMTVTGSSSFASATFSGGVTFSSTTSFSNSATFNSTVYLKSTVNYDSTGGSPGLTTGALSFTTPSGTGYLRFTNGGLVATSGTF
jgi:hypothetical protein